MKSAMYLYHEQYSWESPQEAKLVPWHIKVPDELTGSHIRIFLREVEVELPDTPLLQEAEIRKAMTAGLYKQKEELQAETHVKLQAIDAQIQQLLCIEHKQD